MKELISQLRKQLGLDHVPGEEVEYIGHTKEIVEGYRIYQGREMRETFSYDAALDAIALLVDLHGEGVVQSIKLVRVHNDEEIFLGGGANLLKLIDEAPRRRRNRVIESGPIEMNPVGKRD